MSGMAHGSVKIVKSADRVLYMPINSETAQLDKCIFFYMILIGKV